MNLDQQLADHLGASSGSADMFLINGVAYQLSNLGLLPRYTEITRMFEEAPVPAITAWHRLYDSGHRVDDWEDYYPEIQDILRISEMEVKVFNILYNRYIKPDFFQTLT